MLPLDQFTGMTLPRFMVVIMIIFLASCSKEPAADFSGRWKIEKQLTAHYSGLEKTGEDTIELCSSYMNFSSNGTGSLIHSSNEITFNYIVESDELILSTASCKSSTWYIAEYTGDKLVIEHNYPSMVTVRYLAKMD